MSTVGEVVDRVFRDWLFLPDDQPLVVTLSSSIDDATTSLSYSDDTLAPDEEDALSPGVLVEVVGDGAAELCRITDVDTTANTLTVTRAVNGTEASSFPSGSEVFVAPTFTRTAVVEAVKDNVVALYPHLWHIDTEELTSDSSYVEVPSEVITPRSLVWKNGTRYQNATLPLLLDNFPPSSTDKAIQFHGVPSGYTVYFTYTSKFARPTDESTDLSTLGVEPEWERIVAVGAAAQVVASRPQDRLSAEYLTEQLERETAPPGSELDVRNGLLTLHDIWLRQARRSLRSDQPSTVIYTSVPQGVRR